MKGLFILFLITILSACAADITITHTDLETRVSNQVLYKSARRAVIQIDGVTIITGQVAINDETVQLLGGAAIQVVADKVP